MTNARERAAKRRADSMGLTVGGLLVVGAVLGGCASYKSPQFEVLGVSVKNETAEGYVLEFSLQGTNENTEALPLGDVRYSLQLGGETVFHGARSAEATLPRKGSQKLVLPVSVAWKDDAPRLVDDMRYQLMGSIEYELPGTIAEVMFDAKIRRPTASFIQRGLLDLDPSVDNAPSGDSSD